MCSTTAFVLFELYDDLLVSGMSALNWRHWTRDQQPILPAAGGTTLGRVFEQRSVLESQKLQAFNV